MENVLKELNTLLKTAKDSKTQCMSFGGSSDHIVNVMVSQRMVYWTGRIIAYKQAIKAVKAQMETCSKAL